VLNADSLCCYCVPGTADRARLAKQRQIEGWLVANELGNFVATDRQLTVELDVGCTTSSRPDFIWDLGTHFVILEVDEHQHAGYAEECDCARMINLGEDIMRKGIFVRYNPDSFKAQGRKQNPNWSTRMDVLKKWLQAAMRRRDGATLEIVRLFFDDYQPHTVVFETIR